MIRTKKFWFFCIIFFALAGVLLFFFTAHSMPAYARYIPGDATAVVTLNTKRLATDILLGGKLNQDTSLSANKTFAKWKKALEENEGSGISLKSDILFFSCGCVSPSENQLYGALVLKLDDAQRLNRFITKELPALLDTATMHMSALADNKTYKSLVLSSGFSRDPIYLAFNQDIAIVLKAESFKSTSDWATKELDRIFNESRESSMAANANFIKSERRPADVSLWFDYNHRQLKHFFSPKNDTTFHPGYVNAWLDFNKGAVDLTVYTIPENKNRVPVFRKSHSENDFLKLVAADKFMALLHADIDLQNLFDNLNTLGNLHSVDHTAEQWGLTTKDIASSFDGNTDLALNGFVHYQKKYIDYEYDADFNKIEVEKYKDERMPGFLLKLGLNGSNAMFSLLPKLINSKRIVACKNGYKLNSDIPVYMYPVGNNLYMSNSAELPKEAGDKSLANKDIADLNKRHASFIFCDLQGFRTELTDSQKKTWDIFKSISLSADEEPGSRTELDFSLKFSEVKTNALVQLANMYQEMNKHSQ